MSESRRPALPPSGGLLLVDASSYVFRALFGVPDHFADRRGRPINALVGFTRQLVALVEGARPSRLAVCFDEALFSGFRHRIDPAYKANRLLPDADTDFQLRRCRELAGSLGMTTLASSEYEADDLIATLASRARRRGVPVVVASEDKDLGQAIGEGDCLWHAARGRLLTHDDLRRQWGVAPSMLADLQAIVGDSVDNIPGIPGIGPKTAAALLTCAGSLDRLLRLAEPGRVTAVRSGARHLAALQEQADLVQRNRRLTRLASRVAGLPRLDALRWSAPSATDVGSVAARLDLPRATARRLMCLAREVRP